MTLQDLCAKPALDQLHAEHPFKTYFNRNRTASLLGRWWRRLRAIDRVLDEVTERHSTLTVLVSSPSGNNPNLLDFLQCFSIARSSLSEYIVEAGGNFVYVREGHSLRTATRTRVRLMLYRLARHASTFQCFASAPDLTLMVTLV